MSKTKINGVNIDISLLNQALTSKLEEALNELHSSEQTEKLKIQMKFKSSTLKRPNGINVKETVKPELPYV